MTKTITRRDRRSQRRRLAHRLQRPGSGPSLSSRLGPRRRLVAGTLIGAAAASNAYYDGDTECHYVRRYDRWGNLYRVKVCDVAPY